MFYDCIEITHENEKKPVLLESLDNAYKNLGINTVIINGAQFRKDTTAILEYCILNKLNLILIEYRKDEAQKWIDNYRIKSYENIKLIIGNVDIMVNNGNYEKLITDKKTWVYDNLSGKDRRISYWIKINNFKPVEELIVFAMSRGSIIEKAIEIFSNVTEYKIAPTANILSISKSHNGYKRIWKYKHCKKYDRSIKLHKLMRNMHCPRCGIDWGYLSPRLTVNYYKELKIKNLHCCKCKTVFEPNKAQMCSNTKIKEMLRWCFNE